MTMPERPSPPHEFETPGQSKERVEREAPERERAVQESEELRKRVEASAEEQRKNKALPRDKRARRRLPEQEFRDKDELRQQIKEQAEQLRFDQLEQLQTELLKEKFSTSDVTEIVMNIARPEQFSWRFSPEQLESILAAVKRVGKARS